MADVRFSKRKREERLRGSVPEKTRQVLEEAGKGTHAQTQAVTERRKRLRKEAEAERMNVSSSIIFHKPSTYPDQILTLPFHMQFKLLASRCPIENIEAKMRFLPGPFVQEGISLPYNIRYDLGCNLKFLYPTALKRTILREAYDLFEYKVR